jgi:hypothetical protein
VTIAQTTNSNTHSLNGVQKQALKIPAKVISHTPGRIRIRFAPKHRHRDRMQKITNTLKEHLAIYQVRSNVAGGSITVRYAKEHLNSQDIHAILRDLGIVFEEVALGRSAMATSVTDAVTDLNYRVGKATDGAIDLRLIVPLGFAALALRQLRVQGWNLELIPWYVLAWYAFDSFIKLHYTSDPQSHNS